MTGPASTFLYILLAGVVATAVWRLLGLFLSTGLSEDSPLLEWVRAVSTALVAGFVARTVIFPPGALAEVDVAVRVGAFALGIAAFFLARRHLGIGILAAAGALILAQYVFG
jgi:hypothetical protein